MKLTSKTAGFGIMAVAGLMLCTAAIADTMRGRAMGDDMDGMGGMGGGMGHGIGMMMPSLDAMDANKDGKVSKDEIAAFRKARAAEVDTNADGKLSVDELTAMHLKVMTDAAKTMAQRMIDRMDTDGDGMLSAAELVAPPVPENMFDRLDTNKDGFIDQAEMDAARQMMMQRGQGRGQGRGEGRGEGQGGGRHGGHHMPGMDGGQDDMGGN